MEYKDIYTCMHGTLYFERTGRRLVIFLTLTIDFYFIRCLRSWRNRAQINVSNTSFDGSQCKRIGIKIDSKLSKCGIGGFIHYVKVKENFVIFKLERGIYFKSISFVVFSISIFIYNICHRNSNIGAIGWLV